MSWHDLLLVQGLYALGVLAFLAAGAALAGPAAAAFAGGSASPGPWLAPAAAAGAAFMLASLVLAASRSEFELPVIRALLAAGALLAAVVADQLALGVPFALAWGLAFALAVRAPDGRAWVARGVVLLVAGIVAGPLAVLAAPVAVRAGDDLADRLP
jgi:hypothetical protein